MRKWTGIIIGMVLGAIGGSVLVGPWLHGQPAAQPPLPPAEIASYRDVVKQVLPAVVSLDMETKQTVKPSTEDGSGVDDGGPLDKHKKFFEGSPGQVPKLGFGSGVLISPDGVIVTTYHVVAGYPTVTVKLHDGTKYVTKDIRTDRKTDLAVVIIDTKGKKLPFLELGDSSKMEIGDRVLAVGAPFGLLGSVTHGIISGTGRSGLNMNMYEDFLQTDAPINPGNSGGPLINMAGKVVAINAAIKSRSGGFDGVGLAVASNLARGVAEALVKDGKVRRGYLGAQIIDLDEAVAKQMGLKQKTGVAVSSVFKNTPAAKAGLNTGDIILKIAGKAIPDSKTLQDVVVGLPVQQPAEFQILRDNKPQSLKVIIEEQPDSFGQLSTPAAAPVPQPGAPIEMSKYGLELIDLTPALAAQLGYGADASGVVAGKVNPSGSAHAAGLRDGMLITKVDNQVVTNAEAARFAIINAALSNGILLHVRSPQGSTAFVLLKTK